MATGTRAGLEHAPFDIIVVTAAAEQIPAPLIEQLAEKRKACYTCWRAVLLVQELILLGERRMARSTKAVLLS